VRAGVPVDAPSAKVTFLGIVFDVLNMEEAVTDIVAHTDGPFRYVVTPNVHHMVSILDEGAVLRRLYFGAWRVFCDSRVLRRLARLSGVHLSLVVGSDLTELLLSYASAHGMNVAIVGPGLDDCDKLSSRFPGLSYLSHTPAEGFILSEIETSRAVEFVVKSRAKLIFFAVGMPQQEKLAQLVASDDRARGIGLCIGASIDFLTGKQMRAPLWMQNLGIEWLYRLLTNPRRLGVRYLLACPKIFYYMSREGFRS
jgi:N-acetylglucosaminyldiphosphoundecaprenol N-acetyl-beta-D-mannosaminyltransferase